MFRIALGTDITLYESGYTALFLLLLPLRITRHDRAHIYLRRHVQMGVRVREHTHTLFSLLSHKKTGTLVTFSKERERERERGLGNRAP